MLRFTQQLNHFKRQSRTADNLVTMEHVCEIQPSASRVQEKNGQPPIICVVHLIDISIPPNPFHLVKTDYDHLIMHCSRDMALPPLVTRDGGYGYRPTAYNIYIIYLYVMRLQDVQAYYVFYHTLGWHPSIIYMYLAESVRHQFEFKLEIYVSELVPHWFDVRGRSSSTIKVVLLVHSL